MASYSIQFLFVFCVLIVSVFCEPRPHELGSTDKCAALCKISARNIDSCQRGCRFYAIDTFLSKDNPYMGCANNCDEAYFPVAVKVMDCSQGCNQQHEDYTKELRRSETGNNIIVVNPFDTLPIIPDDQARQIPFEGVPKIPNEDPNQQNPEGGEVSTELEEGSLLNLGTPIMRVRKVMGQILGGLHIIKTSVVTYFLQDNNTVIAMHSMPVVMVENASEGDVALPLDLLNSNQLPRGDEKSSSLFDSLMKPSSVYQDASPRFDDRVEVVPLQDYKTSRYAYLLHLLLLLAVVSLALMGLSYCLAIARSQSRRKNKAANLHMALQHEPLKLVRTEDLTKLSLVEEDDQQAPALPLKQDIALTHALV